MKRTLPIFIVGWFALSFQVFAQSIRPFSLRYYNPSVRGNIVYVSNTSISTSGVGSGNPGTGEAPPNGTTRNNNGSAININVDATTYIPMGSSWKYWANTQANYPNNWNTVGFNDAAWPSGNGELGYGDGDEATCIPSGGGGTLCTPSGNKYISYYFRRTVNISNPAAISSFTFNVERDDGYVVYVNGVEVARNNMPAGAVTWATLASSAVEDAVITFSIPNTNFVSGNNVIAVEIHQAAASSSDVSFNLSLTGSSAFNSSTADLSLPSCSSILWAGLYWGAGQGTNGTNTGWITGETTCKLKVPGSSTYTTITSTQTDYHNAALVPGLPHTGYKCYRDITSLLNVASPNGTYTVADVVGPIGINNGYGGWTIVVAYENLNDIIRELNVFDGNAIVDQGQPPVDVVLNGFNTPLTGPVTCELGAVCYDGDRSATDSFAFRQAGAPAFINLTPNATSNLNDMWNSTISYKGAVVTTRNPAFQNTLGYDADIIDLPNAGNVNLGNNQTSATIRIASPSENFILQVVTASISIMDPFVRLLKSSTDVNGGALLGGEELRYDLSYINNGNDLSTYTVIYDTIPVGTSYKPNSLFINGVAKTDAIGDDEAEYDHVNNRVIFRVGTGASGVSGGTLALGASGSVWFSVYTTNSCFLRTCNSTIRNKAWVRYTGPTSGITFLEDSKQSVSGCFLDGMVENIVTGSCRSLKDTAIANICPTTTVTLPVTSFTGYRFYSGFPFNDGTAFNPATVINFSRVLYAYYDGPGSCDDTVQINVFVTACPDIDDDNDGIPDYVELNNPLAWGDHDNDGILNWNDVHYPGYIDHNTDGFNDNFDPSADSDNDGVPNFNDPQFSGFTDSNGDGVNDQMDQDLDGIPNHLDLDSDNDGIPDTVESFGVDANGDGRIDNYTETDNDGFSQNVDANNTGVHQSGLGLGPLDTDGDGVPNYLDLDSDNDGIPDLVEVYGTDNNHNGMVDVFVDVDGDGMADAIDGDVGNDGIAENASNALLRTGADLNNDGRCDSWPYKNMDAESKPNPYDLDSDGDGITDVREANFSDVNWDGRVDGAVNSNGWNTTIVALSSLNLPNTDATGRTNPYDIDSDDDGIPDNVEGLSTSSYLLPVNIDTDGDGLDNSYDNFAGFGGNGVAPNDQDNDGIPDYRDLDTDSDGLIDRFEGNDFNLNGLVDDEVTLTGIDTDDDGLDDRFDANNTNSKGTSSRMGGSGSFTGDVAPGAHTTVQRTIPMFGCNFERDWRCHSFLLECEILSFQALLKQETAQLSWSAVCRTEVAYFEIERSFDQVLFGKLATVEANPLLLQSIDYSYVDTTISKLQGVLYYRLRIVLKNGKVIYSHVSQVRLKESVKASVQVLPNPVAQALKIKLNSPQQQAATLYIYDQQGRTVSSVRLKLKSGETIVEMNDIGYLGEGLYRIAIKINDEVLTQQFLKLNK